MILEGNARGSGAELARHLLNARDNEHVTVHSVDGFIASDLAGALEEAEAISQATQCKKYLFSLSLNPPVGAQVSVEDFEAAISQAERELGLKGQPKAVVFHEKNGRRHAHVVWSRIDTNKMKAIQLPHFKRRLMAVSRSLYIEHGWDMPEGFTDHDKRDPNRFDHVEAAQAKAVDCDPEQLKALFRTCWECSDNAVSLDAALREQGFVLAQGDRRGFVAVDASGKVYSLSRWCGVRARELKERLGDYRALPQLDQAKEQAQRLNQTPEALKPKRDEQAEAKLAALVTRQRAERSMLLAAQERAEAERLKQVPRGMKIAFLKVTGRYEAYVARQDASTKDARARDRLARQALIDLHLEERQAFDRDERRLRPDPQQSLRPTEEQAPLTARQVKLQPALILDEISQQDDSFTRTDVLGALSRWVDEPNALHHLADKALSSDQAVNLASDTKVAQRFTTRDYQRTEAQLHGAAAAMSKANTVRVDAQHIQAAIKSKNIEMQRTFGGELSSEQAFAIRTVLQPKQLGQVVGLAGAGKSTMLAVAADAWGRQGIKVHGAALAGKASDGLEASAGIQSRTLASLELSWKNGHEPIKRGEVLVIDEAGMIGTRQMARVTQKMQDVGAKLVLVGDPDQLQPIEAGTPFRDMVARHGAAKLTEVRRQKADWQRAATQDLAKGETDQGVAAYRAAGAVSEHAEQAHAIEALAERYAMDALADKSNTRRIALAHRRADVHALNQAIRTAIRDPETTQNDVLLDTATGARAFGTGDRLVFTRNDKELGVKNGMIATVTSATPDGVLVQMDGDDHRHVRFDPGKYAHFDHGYAVTIHKSQGVTVDQSYVLGSRTLDKHLTYVALTRHREDVQIYTSREDALKWANVPLEREPRTSSPQHVQHRPRSRDGPSLG